MKTFTFLFKLYFLILIALPSVMVQAQQNGNLLERVPSDTTAPKMNMDAVYNRPFLQAGKIPVAVGGYMETNTQYAVTDGITEGFSFQFRRTNLFFSSLISKKIKFFSELEFEDGAKEINLEAAFMDFEFHRALNLRAGIIINSIGAFNQNHDGPRWEIIDRPLSATTILPATLSNAGIGLLGKTFVQNWSFGYEVYVTNGFDDRVIANDQGRTSLASGKSNPEKFEESNSGLPMVTAKLAFRNRRIGEVGLSYMGGVYNKWKDDGTIIDSKRRITALAVDANTALLSNRIMINGEVAKVFVEVPGAYSQSFGTRQWGGFVDLVFTIIKKPIFGWATAKVNLALRAEYADYNQGKFREENGLKNIADDTWAIVPALSFRPVATTVIRLNYRHQQQKDLFGNPPAKTGIAQFGFATYF